MSLRPAASPSMRGPLAASAIAHGALVAAAMIAARGEPPPALPPVYRVNLVAAPPGPRQAGIVRPPEARAPAPPAPAPEAEPAPSPRAPETPVPETMPSPTATPPARQQARATPNPAPAEPAPPRTRQADATTTKAGDPDPAPARPTPRTPAPTAGGGPTGGRGTDVASVDLRGIEFPFQPYLDNIVRQIALRFEPAGAGRPLAAEVVFTILRDGSVREVRFLKRSGDYEFDSEARGAVESAARAKAFGALPDGYRDDALTVYFSFDPRIIR